MPLLRFGVPAALGWLLAELVLNIDYVIIGREMSTADLGEYMLAFNIASWPTAVLGAVVAQIVLPAFSAVRLGGGDLGLTVSRAIRTVGFVACPIAAFTCAFAYPLIETVYGARWLGAAPVLRLLALYGALYVLGLLFDNIMVAAGKTFAMFAVQAAALVTLVPALIVGAPFGWIGWGRHRAHRGRPGGNHACVFDRDIPCHRCWVGCGTAGDIASGFGGRRGCGGCSAGD